LHALREAAAATQDGNQTAQVVLAWQRPNLQSIGNATLQQRRQEQHALQRKVAPPRGAGSFFVVPTVLTSAETQHDPAQPATNMVGKVATGEIRMYPDLLLGMLRGEQVAAGRVWLLCRHLDSSGRGWLDLAAIRVQLTGQDSAMRIVGKRRLRQILADGEKRFWERDDRGRLWLYGVARVAAALDVERLTLRPIALPIADLIAGLAETRAHCYAAFHSGRSIDSTSELGNPISRATLTDLCGMTDRTQRRYDRLVGVETRPCIAVGAIYEQASHAEAAWQQRGTFKLTDHQGLQGQAGRSYTAWQLPNQYRACHVRLPNGRQRKLNRQLQQLAPNHDDLVTQRAQGNDMEVRGRQAGQFEPARRFFDNGNAALNARTTEGYWFNRTTRKTGVWIPIA
jgi:hypothetical protein